MGGFTPFVATIGGLVPPLPVADGGTGGTTAATALAGLGIPSAQGLQAATPLAGVALINGTQTLCSWTAPNDGAEHRVTVSATSDTTVAATGGNIAVQSKAPDGLQHSESIIAGNQVVGGKSGIVGTIVQAGQTVSVLQSTALTAGTETVWAEIFGS